MMAKHLIDHTLKFCSWIKDVSYGMCLKITKTWQSDNFVLYFLKVVSLKLLQPFWRPCFLLFCETFCYILRTVTFMKVPDMQRAKIQKNTLLYAVLSGCIFGRWWHIERMQMAWFQFSLLEGEKSIIIKYYNWGRTL